MLILPATMIVLLCLSKLKNSTLALSSPSAYHPPKVDEQLYLTDIEARINTYTIRSVVVS